MKTITTLLNHGKDGNVPEMIVIHAMGEFVIDGTVRQHAVKFLDRCGLSAHSLIAPSGTNYRCRLDVQTAYHARGFNTNSLGLECLVEGEHGYASFIEAIKKPYLTEDQYQAILDQTRHWLNAHDSIRKIARHSDLSPGRKVDPGEGFPWGDFLHDLGWTE